MHGDPRNLSKSDEILIHLATHIGYLQGTSSHHKNAVPEDWYNEGKPRTFVCSTTEPRITIMSARYRGWPVDIAPEAANPPQEPGSLVIGFQLLLHDLHR